MMRQNLRQITLFLLCFFIATSAFCATKVKSKIVRVGWFNSAYNQLDSSGERMGYGYDYQRSIAANAGWRYEYVEGEWDELFDKLQKGEIDLLSDVSYIPDRQKSILYSERVMGREEYYIVYCKNNRKIKRGHPETLQGMRIAVSSGSYHASLLRKWLKFNNVQADVRLCRLSPKKRLEAMKKGEYDAIACSGVLIDLIGDDCVTFAPVGLSDVWFGINKNRPDLKRDLDEAMATILSYNQDYEKDLADQYIKHAKRLQHATAKEEAWMKTHKTIRIGYKRDYMPFCDLDEETGEVVGVLGDFITTFNREMKMYGVRVEAVPFDSFSSAVDDMKEGRLDAAFPNGMSPCAAEQEGLIVTEPLAKSTEVAIVRSDYKFDMKNRVRLTVISNNPKIIATAKEQFPGWDVVLFPDIHASLKGVAKGKADAVVGNYYRIYRYYGEMEDLKLKTVPTGYMISHSFAVNEGDCELYALLNRIINAMPVDGVNMSLAKSSISQDEYSLTDFVRANIKWVFVVFLAIISMFVFLLYYSFRAHRKARRASDAKTRFLFNMSHDIRTPMNAIIGLADLMEQNVDDSRKVLGYIDKLRKSSRYLLELINNVLEMSRIESGKTELNEEPQVICDILNTSVTLYADMMKQKGIDFLHTSSVRSKAVYCDRMKVNEIIVNLLSNACKYTPKGGTVTFDVSEAENPKKGYTTIVTRVSDTGEGMSKDFLPHIFEDFARERTSTESKIVGTGLGMSIVKRLVEQMHGTIEVESEKGKGTTFTVSLPQRIADVTLLENGGSYSTEPASSLKGKHILLAEDNELNAEIAMEMLAEDGFAVTWAKNGQECVDMLCEAEAGTYDLILMDVQMPVMDGYATTRAIRAMSDPKKSYIPIIAMTANAFAEDKQNALLAGMNAHVAKPVDVPKLLHTMEQLLA